MSYNRCECDNGMAADDTGKCEQIVSSVSYEEPARKCEAKGGDYNITNSKCMCGSAQMYPETQMCNEGKIE